MRNVTIGDIRQRARDEADQSKSNFVSDEELLTVINAEYCALYDILVTTFEHYAVKELPHTIVIDPNVDTYPLPSDFYKLQGVDKRLDAGSGGNARWFTLRPFNFGERNTVFAAEMRYALLGLNIVFRADQLSGEVNLWYTPHAEEFVGKFSGASFDNTTSTVTLTGHGFVEGDFIRLIGGVAPTGLLPDTRYYVINTTADTFQLATSPFAIVKTFTDNGSGNIQIRWYGDGQTIDGVSGWEEMIVLKAAIYMLDKEESSTTALTKRMEEMKERITAAAHKRDEGAPRTITDVVDQNCQDQYGYWFYR